MLCFWTSHGQFHLQTVTVTAKYADTGDVVVSRQVAVSSDRKFNLSLLLYASTSPLLLTFEATYKGAKSAAVIRYITEIQVSSGEQVEDTRQTVVGTGAYSPVYLRGYRKPSRQRFLHFPPIAPRWQLSRSTTMSRFSALKSLTPSTAWQSSKRMIANLPRYLERSAKASKGLKTS